MIDDLIIVPLLLFSVVVHEVAHGWMALKLGDTTARDLGRLTLNPLPHMDLVGSLLVPLMSLMAAGRIFLAWAKPVPVNSAVFAHPRRDQVLVSIVGPVSNLAIAFVCSLVLVLLGSVAGLTGGLSSTAETVVNFLWKMFAGGISVNIMLAVFNLLPVPPLDGSHLLVAVLPPALARPYRRIGFAGVFLLILLMRIPAVSHAFTGCVNIVHIPYRAFIESCL